MAKKLTAAIIHIIQTGLTDICLSQTSLYLLLMTLDVGNLGALFDSSRHNGQYWGINYLFQMASRFSKAKKSNLAFDTLQKIAVHPSGANFNALSMHMLFSTLLRYENRADRDTYSDGVLWEFVTSRGLRPNSQHYNILIANNFQRGNAEGAWAVYQAMLEDNITPTAFTHSVLLTYSKRSLDRVAVQRALALIRARNMQMNPYLANDHLHSIFLFYRDEYERIEGDVLPDEIMAIKGRPRAFEHMLPVYCAYFDPRPLALCLGHRVHDYPQLSRLVSEAKDLMQPSKETLTIMYIGLLYGMTDARDVIEAYHQFRTLLRHEDPEFVSRLHQSHIYDAFLMKFGKFPDTLERCPKIVEDMLTTSKSGIESIVMHTDATFYQNLIPTTHTWNILLHVYAYRGQMIAAHRVLEIMQERDIAPTKVTWGTLATGYARVQNIPGTLNATDHLTEIGARDNAVGTLALNKIKDTRTLYATMEAMEKQKAERLAAGESLPADAKEDLAVRRVSRIQEAITDMDNSAWHKRQYWDNVFKKFRKPKAQVSQPGSKKPSLVKRLEASINLTSHKLGFQSPVVEAIPSKETNSWTGVAHWHTESPVEGKIVQLTLPAKSEKGPRRVIIKALKYINNLLLDVEQRRAITPSGVQPAVALEIAIREAMLAASSNITAEQEDSASSSNKYIPESEGVEKPGAWSHEAGLP
ncbi:hypothetical protein BJ878DRAFT_540438 [Calycina marina]|uniref:Pentatricopeptide repeat-containing protein n=1 Tax=Calycina marina TaxID=1763456 RepID=A0A9P8CGI2_9HELO|nr:hypothetical protein BJ878DRAFT_540438 [Calycina marina]